MENDNSLLYFMHNIDLDIANLIRHSSVKLNIAMTFYFQLNREKKHFFLIQLEKMVSTNYYDLLLLFQKKNRKH